MRKFNEIKSIIRKWWHYYCGKVGFMFDIHHTVTYLNIFITYVIVHISADSAYYTVYILNDLHI